MHLSLRAKLILVMSAVVAGATIGTALVSQGVVRKAYEDKFESDFKAEVRYFSERQLRRLESMKAKCKSLAGSATLIAAVEKREPAQIKPVVQSELKEFYQSQVSEPGSGFLAGLTRLPTGMRGSPPLRPDSPNVKKGKGGAPPEPEPRPAPMQPLAGKLAKAIFSNVDHPTVTVVDPDGELICMFDPKGQLMSIEEARLAFNGRSGDKPRSGQGPPSKDKSVGDAYRQTLKRLAAHVGDEQELAYTTARGLDDHDMIRSLIVTPVLNKETNAAVGAVILSVLSSDLGEREMQNFSRETDNDTNRSTGKEEGISSGFWLEGALHTKTIPANAREAVSGIVSSRVEAVKDNARFHEAALSLPVDDELVPHKLIFRVLNPDSPFPPACQVALYSLKDEIAQEHALQKQIFSIGLIALAVAMGCILILSRSLVKPIADLVTGTEQIRSGNYDVRVKSTRRDELGQLAVSFNEMADGLRLNQKYQRLLSQFADRMVVEQLINNEAALGGELREVSVLFCDIRGFTKLTTGMPPGEVIAMLNEHMSAFIALVHDHFGVVDKFVGDMVMAIFGAPAAHGDDAKRAAMCALRMIQMREELNAAGSWQVQVGVGVATGTVVAGCMGSSERLDYTVLGEKVNLASRLCDHAGPGEVLIDDTTRDVLGKLAETDTLPNLELKGYAEQVTAYRLWAMHSYSEEHAFDTTALVHSQA